MTVVPGMRTALSIKRAREMRPLIRSVDYLLDIHSMQTRTAPLMLAAPRIVQFNHAAQSMRFCTYVTPGGSIRVCDSAAAPVQLLRDGHGRRQRQRHRPMAAKP